MMKNIGLIILIITAISACGSTSRSYKSSRSPYQMSMEGSGNGYAISGNQVDDGYKLGQTQPTDDKTQRVVLYNANMTIAVKSTDSIAEFIERKANSLKGYTTNKSTTSITVRVPKDSLDTVLDYIAELGRVDSKKVSGNDVTDQYMDLSIRLDNAEKARARYLELLAKAEDVKAALLVEKELERLNGLIDSYKGSLNRYDHLSTYSTVTVTIKEKKKPGILGYIGLGIYHAVKWLFVRN